MHYDVLTMIGIFLPVPLMILSLIGLLVTSIRSRNGKSLRSRRIWGILLIVSIFWLIGSAAIVYGLARSTGPELA